MQTPTKVRKAEKKLPEELGKRRCEERKAAEVQATVDRPLVDFVKVVLSLGDRTAEVEYHAFRVAALFLLATRLSSTLDCMEAYKTLRTDGDDFYEVVTTTMAYRWLCLAKKGDIKEDREAAAAKLFKVCAEHVGIEWKAEFLEEWAVFEPAKWGEEMHPWRCAVL